MKLLLFFFFILSTISYSQVKGAFDENLLEYPVKNYKDWNTDIVDSLINSAYDILYEYPSSTDSIAKEIYNYGFTSNNREVIASALMVRGNSHIVMQDFNKALNFFNQLMEPGVFSQEYQIKALGSAGIIYYNMKEYPKALNTYQQSLELAKQNDMPYSSQLNNICLVYQVLEMPQKQIEYARQAINYGKTNPDKTGLSIAYNNMGIAQKNSGSLDSAIYFYKNAYDIAVEGDYINLIGDASENLGNIYSILKDYDKADYFFEEKLKLVRKRNQNGFSIYTNLAHNSFNRGEFEKGLKYLDSTQIYFDRNETLANQISFFDAEAKLREGLNDIPKAYYSLKKMVKLRDSLEIIESKDQITELDKKYALRNAEIQDSLKFAIEKNTVEQRNQTERKYQSNVIKIISIAAILLLVGLFFLLKLFNSTKKAKKLVSQQNLVLETQKSKIEEKNRELTSSIEYAKNLQDAVIPSYYSLSSHFKETGLVFKPKDIVSGDFYWVHENESHLYFAVADCTGHGVPGAIVSMIGINGLESCMKEHNLTDPSEILTQLSEIVEKTFDSHGENVQDGMDISLCRFDKETRELAYSGANNPIWILDEKESHIIQPTKRPVGKYTYDRNFETKTLTLKENQLLCLFSDGMPDQFGGEKGKKLKYKVFQDLIKSNIQSTAHLNAEKLAQYFEEWKGELEQIDDVSVLLIRL